MRILSVHNTYQIRGGEDESWESENRLLREQGHIVDIYQETNDRIQEINAVQLAIKTVWSQETYRHVRSCLAQQTYDIVHVQNFFPLISPAVHHAAQAAGVPVVQTLRNYRLLCPNGLFFRNGHVCEDCVGKAIPYPGVLHGCYRNDKAASTAVAAMITAHRAIKTWLKAVDLFITLTEFSRQKFIEAGMPADKIFVKPNFIHPLPEMGTGTGNYALFVGRLSVEKGLDTLIEAWRKLSSPVPLKIVGDGPLADVVKVATQEMPNIEWLGRRPMPEVHALMGEAKFLVFPSKWYETFGRVAIEAFATGTPVVAANIGAIAELVQDGQTGLLFAPGNTADLSQKVTWLLNRPDVLTQMRQQARQTFLDRYQAPQNYELLFSAYQKAQMIHDFRH